MKTIYLWISLCFTFLLTLSGVLLIVGVMHNDMSTLSFSIIGGTVSILGILYGLFRWIKLT